MTTVTDTFLALNAALVRAESGRATMLSSVERASYVKANELYAALRSAVIAEAEELLQDMGYIAVIDPDTRVLSGADRRALAQLLDALTYGTRDQCGAVVAANLNEIREIVGV